MPNIVCNGCGNPMSLGKPLCEACINELIKTRTHLPLEWCWCEPYVDYQDPDNGNRVLVHREIQ
jgi:predicted amidophosphoribosyltransferase